MTLPDLNLASINKRLDDTLEALAKSDAELKWEMAGSAADIAGLVDPTPTSDLIGAGLALRSGDFIGAALSTVSMVPYVGDAMAKPVKAVRTGKKIVALEQKVAKLTKEANDLKKLKKEADGIAAKETKASTNAEKTKRAAAEQNSAASTKGKDCDDCQQLAGANKQPAHQSKETKDFVPQSSRNGNNTSLSSTSDKGRAQRENGAMKQTGSGSYTGDADEMYDQIRASKTDVDAISSQTGIKAKNIQKVKDHVFMEEHLLDRYVDYGIPAELKRFDSSASQAEAWKRLETGTHSTKDIQWLKHETAERWFEKRFNSGYSAAHDAAEKRWPGNPWE